MGIQLIAFSRAERPYDTLSSDTQFRGAARPYSIHVINIMAYLNSVDQLGRTAGA